jgi:hypothetical protein
MEDEESWWDWWCLRKRDDQARRKEEGRRGRRNGVERQEERNHEKLRKTVENRIAAGKRGSFGAQKGPARASRLAPATDLI